MERTDAAAFGNGSIDVALSLCPEIAAELEFAAIRKEGLVALLPVAHPLAGEEAIPLSALSDEEFVVFPREIAPRLHDAFMAIYRRAGFEPRVRNESFHTGWDLGLLAEIPAAAMAPQTVAGGLPAGIVAVAISEPTDALETCLVWRARRHVARRGGIRGGRPLGHQPLRPSDFDRLRLARYAIRVGPKPAAS